MKSKKKKTVAIAMATIFGASGLMSPVAVYAQEELVNVQKQMEESQTKQNVSQQPVTIDNGGIPVSGNIDINETNFPDKEFRDWIKTHITGADDDVLTPEEISNVKNIVVSNKGEIKNLKGIEYFTALEYLICFNTGITTLDVSNNKQLTKLDCNNTGITTLNVRNNEKLTYLDCYNTGITTLDVRNNEKLAWLRCHSTDITTLNVSKNKQLTYLDCNNTGITTLDVRNNELLTGLYCHSTSITELDVRNNTLLKNLNCNNTGITELDVSNNKQLTMLDCSSTSITTLNVSNNKQLTKLDCNNTGITTLDVSKNTQLSELDCNNTSITALDVSNNKQLTALDCTNTPLAFLKLGSLNLSSYHFDVPSSTIASLSVTSASFDITQAFAGIDTAKISNVQGAELDGNTVKGYSVGTPITYTYDCGTNKGNPVKLSVILNLSKTVSTIVITGSLDTTYTGKPMDKPTVNKIGSTGDVTFTYQVKNGDTWEDYNNIPINAGTYQVQAHLADDGFNSEAKSEYTKFTIEKATNTWTSQPYLTGWTYGQPANTPTAGAQFGDVSYSYSGTENGTYTSDVPANAGTWYVKAIVEGTENYTDLEAYLPFTIARKNVEGNSDITISDINNDKDIEKLIVKDDNTVLVKGTDYDVKIKKDGNKTTVIITFIGNYEGAIEKNLTVEETVKPEQNPQNNLQDKPKDTGSVKTGDSTQTGLFTILSVISAGCIALLAGKKRKKNVKEDETTPL
ncbi:leucine-rich repeat domain-containing protein [Erysipelotrichaceae bacterium AF19-24AC]|nr:leucine-rich repeat domain-containing protein [Erysipelotrichaceae bacterium AF19-24AC]